MTQIDFRCGRCRLRGSVTAPALIEPDTLVRFVARAHLAMKPDCGAPDSAMQIIRVGAERKLATTGGASRS